MDKTTPELELPGFRFHPTEEELLDFYLKNILFGKKLRFDIIGFRNIYHHDPWELPGLAKIGEREWYFFVRRDRKHGSGGRPNRTTEHGFWKATGSDRTIRSLSDPKRIIGLRKTLVFYQGRAPRGSKTDWVMNEYRMPDSCSIKEDIVLCKIYRKATSMKVLEQRAAMEEEMKTPLVASSPPTTMDTVSFHDQLERSFAMPMPVKTEEEEVEKNKEEDPKYIDDDTSSSLQMGSLKNLTELQVPKFSLDWTQDPFWTQLRSPWLDNCWAPYANVLNF